jgi:hypothetical protein
VRSGTSSHSLRSMGTWRPHVAASRSQFRRDRIYRFVHPCTFGPAILHLGSSCVISGDRKPRSTECRALGDLALATEGCGFANGFPTKDGHSLLRHEPMANFDARKIHACGAGVCDEIRCRLVMLEGRRESRGPIYARYHAANWYPKKKRVAWYRNTTSFAKFGEPLEKCKRCRQSYSTQSDMKENSLGVGR